jgi:predicted GNAT superfamily acetyltransferase
VSGAATEIPIPPDLYELRERDPDGARRWRDEVATAAEAAIGRGEVGLAFDRDRSAYLFAPREVAP